jgi:hypothetical protein
VQNSLYAAIRESDNICVGRIISGLYCTKKNVLLRCRKDGIPVEEGLRRLDLAQKRGQNAGSIDILGPLVDRHAGDVQRCGKEVLCRVRREREREREATFAIVSFFSDVLYNV